MNNDDKIRTGLWKKESTNGGAGYYGGKVEIAGIEYWVNLYKNDRKESDKHPDLTLQLKPKDGQVPQRSAPANDFADDGIGF
jgi:hypothetical protein